MSNNANASIYVGAPTGHYKVGETFSLSVRVNTYGNSINAVSANVLFSNDTLNLLSVSKTPSIVKFWVEDPSYSNSSGSATFQGVIPNPGYLGNGGQIVTLVFRAKAVGPASLSISSGSVLANDGQGTEIGSQFTGTNFSICRGKFCSRAEYCACKGFACRFYPSS